MNAHTDITAASVTLTFRPTGPECLSCSGGGVHFDNVSPQWAAHDRKSLIDCDECGATGRMGLPVKMLVQGLSMQGQKNAKVVAQFRDDETGLSMLRDQWSRDAVYFEDHLGLTGEALTAKLDEEYPLLAQLRELQVSA